MPYKNKEDRNYKRDWEKEKARQKADPKKLEAKMDRQRARRELDKNGVDRTGKDIDHKKPLSKGGSNAPSNRRLVSKHTNRSYAINSYHTPK